MLSRRLAVCAALLLACATDSDPEGEGTGGTSMPTGGSTGGPPGGTTPDPDDDGDGGGGSSSGAGPGDGTTTTGDTGPDPDDSGGSETGVGREELGTESRGELGDPRLGQQHDVAPLEPLGVQGDRARLIGLRRREGGAHRPHVRRGEEHRRTGAEDADDAATSRPSGRRTSREHRRDHVGPRLASTGDTGR